MAEFGRRGLGEDIGASAAQAGDRDAVSGGDVVFVVEAAERSCAGPSYCKGPSRRPERQTERHPQRLASARIPASLAVSIARSPSTVMKALQADLCCLRCREHSVHNLNR